MTHWKKLFKNEESIGSHDLEIEGVFTEKIVHIENLYNGFITGSAGKMEKVMAKLREFDKPMVVNKENFKRLQTLFKSHNYEDYIGKSITLKVEQVKSPEGMVPALRFSARPPVQPDPTQEQSGPTLKPVKDADFPKALEQVKLGVITKEKLKQSRALTADQLKQLDNVQV